MKDSRRVRRGQITVQQHIDGAVESLIRRSWVIAENEEESNAIEKHGVPGFYGSKSPAKTEMVGSQ